MYKISFLLKKIFYIIKLLNFKKTNLKNIVLENGNLSNSNVIAITHNYWAGVYNAAKNQSKFIISVNSPLNKKNIKKIIETIKKLRIYKIAIHGILDNCDILLKDLFNNKKLDIFLIWHGSFTQQTIEDHIARFNSIKKYLHKFKKIGFIKPDMAKIFKLNGYKNAEFIPNTINLKIKTKINKLNHNTIKIGIFGWWTWHKNILNQIIAASIIKSAKIYTTFFPRNIFYINKIINKKIILLGYLNHFEILKKVNEMNLLLAVSLTECYPNLLLESFYFSKPILLGKYAKKIIKDNYLRKNLIINDPEDIFEIKNKIENIINNYEKISNSIKNYFTVLIKQNNKKIIKFYNS
ncbi:MAG: hypothetical protein Fur009_6690 [Candidatus Microgenomates bacterium]